VVKYGETYYIYKGTNNAGGAWSSGNWENFGAQFSSVATDLLLALNANIGGWVFKNERLESQSGGAYLDGRDGTVAITGKLSTGVAGEDRIEIDPSTRSIKMIDSEGDTVAMLSFDSDGAPMLELTDYEGVWGERATIDHSGIKLRGPRPGTQAEFSSTRLVVFSLPTSTFGLQNGEFYDDNGTVKIYHE
jgi:hypothetical protein